MIDSERDVLSSIEIKTFQARYNEIVEKGKKECPLSEKIPGQKGRIKKSKSRNLLERLDCYQEDTLRFMKEAAVPFTNNMGENDLRMTKVQQKISGCFRSMDGAQEFKGNNSDTSIPTQLAAFTGVFCTISNFGFYEEGICSLKK